MPETTRHSRPVLKIRKARADDAERLLSLIRALAVYEKLEAEVVATPESLRATLFGERPAAEVLLAERAGEVVGYALFFSTYSTFLARPGVWLEDLFVLPAHRGRGCGRALLAAVAARAEVVGGRLQWAVLEWNTPAIGFYQALGARPLEGWSTFGLTGEALARLAASGGAGASGEGA